MLNLNCRNCVDVHFFFVALRTPELQGMLIHIIKDPNSPYTPSNFKRYFQLRYVRNVYEGGGELIDRYKNNTQPPRADLSAYYWSKQQSDCKCYNVTHRRKSENTLMAYFSQKYQYFSTIEM